MSEWRETEFGRIPPSWELTTIEEIQATKKYAISMGPFGSDIKVENFVDEGIPVIRGKNLNHYKYVDGDFAFISNQKAEQLNSSICLPGDIVFTHRGTIGQVGLIPNNKYPKYVISQSGMKLTVNERQASPQFLFYFFTSRYGQFQLLKYESQVGVPSISNPLSSLKQIEIPFPPLPVQRAIASVLGSLDDKIDLLHRQNKTLEALAETLFRKYFIDDAQDHWEEKSLLEVIELVGGGTPKTSIDSYWNGNVKWLSGGDIAANHKSVIIHSEKCISVEGLNNSSAKLLPAFSTVISARGTVGKYCILSEPMAFSQSNYGIVPRIEETYFFSYLVVNNLVKELESAAYGSVFDTITTSTFKEQSVLLPPDQSRIVDFEKEIEPYFKKIVASSKQIQKLEKLRDTLLPKLMSGEVRVA